MATVVLATATVLNASTAAASSIPTSYPLGLNASLATTSPADRSAQTAPCSGQASGRIDNGTSIVEATVTCLTLKLQFTSSITPPEGSSCPAPQPKLAFEPLTVAGSLTYQTRCTGGGIAKGAIQTVRKVRVTDTTTGKTLLNWTTNRASSVTPQPGHSSRQDENAYANQVGLINFAVAGDLLSNISVCEAEVNVLAIPILASNIDEEQCVSTGGDDDDQDGA